MEQLCDCNADSTRTQYRGTQEEGSRAVAASRRVELTVHAHPAAPHCFVLPLDVCFLGPRPVRSGFTPVIKCTIE